METKSELLYLDLMKKTLSFMLWEEPGIPLTQLDYALPLPIRAITRTVSYLLQAFQIQLVRQAKYDEHQRIDGRFWPSYAHTMIGMKRLNNIQFCLEQVIQNNIAGDIIEAGVWRGGAAIFMRAILAAYQVTDRRVFLADSFAGLPPPNAEKYPQDQHDKLYKSRFLAVSQEAVAANFAKYGLLDEQVIFLKGWFKDTLPIAPIEKLAVIRIDGDMYESTLDVLSNLYAKLSVGGFCIVDDYHDIRGCQQAVDDFRARWAIKNPLLDIDWTGVYWQKSE